MYDAVMVTMGYGRRAQAVWMAGLAALLALHGCSADDGPEEGDDGVDAGQDAAAASDPFWSALSEAAWLEPRMEHTAVWSGTEMIVWGGVGGSIESEPSFGDGGRYDPSTESWRPMTEQGAPSPRAAHTAVWTGEEMIVWGGAAYDGEQKNFSDGGRYDPLTDSWRPISLIGAPSARYRHVAAWTGSQMIVWGGSSVDNGTGILRDGGIYDLATDSWWLIEEFGLPAEVYSSNDAVWTGSQLLLVATSYSGSVPYAVVFFNPATGVWSVANMSGAPNVVEEQVTWTGTELLLWGQRIETVGSTGSRYDPVTDSWSPMSKAGAPSDRSLSTMVWADSRAFLWGGIGRPTTGNETALKTGAAYDPIADAWDELPRPFDDVGREAHTAVWTGSEMIAWGGRRSLGQAGEEFLNSGIRYRPQ
jgi:N-acetylneuraminic acid mutarotase